MYCSKCGKELPEGSRFCPNCGNSVDFSTPLPSQTSSGQEQNAPSTEQQNIPPASEQSTPSAPQQNISPVSEQDTPPVPNEEIKCPNCGASGCTPQYKQNVSGGGYGCCSGGLGALILGPLGLLCGACGRSVKSTNTLVWICPKCGHEFQVLSEEQKKTIYPRSVLMVCIIGFVVMIVAFLTGEITAFPNMHWDGSAIIGILSPIVLMIVYGFLFYKNLLPFITEEQKQKLKKIAIVMGIIAFICFLIPFILVASIQSTRA